VLRTVNIPEDSKHHRTILAGHFAAHLRRGAQMILVLSSTTFARHAPRIAELASADRLPARWSVAPRELTSQSTIV
jgi:hypothetical protein